MSKKSSPPHRYGAVYVIKNKITGMLYVGKTIRHDVKVRWHGHWSASRGGKRSPLWDDMRLYGRGAFEFCLVACALPGQLGQLELDVIDAEGADVRGYNLAGRRYFSAQSERMKLFGLMFGGRVRLKPEPPHDTDRG